MNLDEILESVKEIIVQKKLKEIYLALKERERELEVIRVNKSGKYTYLFPQGSYYEKYNGQDAVIIKMIDDESCEVRLDGHTATLKKSRLVPKDLSERIGGFEKDAAVAAKTPTPEALDDIAKKLMNTSEEEGGEDEHTNSDNK